MTAPEPLLNTVRIDDLRPTQMTVGFGEVSEKQKRWLEKSASGEAAFLGRHMVPAVSGPKNRTYVIDNHHLCRALMEAGEAEVLVNIVADLSRLSKAEFWTFLDNRGWCHPYDRDGERRDFKAIPKSIGDMVDDPYRSLAGELRRAGGFAKETTPFSEFIWADFLRRRVALDLVQEHFGAALTEALRLSKDPVAAHLPGWCGPSS